MKTGSTRFAFKVTGDSLWASKGSLSKYFDFGRGGEVKLICQPHLKARSDSISYSNFVNFSCKILIRGLPAWYGIEASPSLNPTMKTINLCTERINSTRLYSLDSR